MATNHRASAAAGLCLCLCAGAMASSSGLLRSGDPYIIDFWEKEDGLPQNEVTSIVQTRDGYLWFGTLNGLVRFDGMRFTVFDESNTHGLESSRIVSLFEDREGNLWVGTQAAGVMLIKDGRVTSMGIGQGSSDRHLAAACEDAEGAIWLYLTDGQLWHYQAGRFTPFVFGVDGPSACRRIIADDAGSVWVGTSSRLAAIRPVPGSELLEPQVEQDLPVRRLDFLLASQHGGFWRLADGRVQKWSGNQMERDLGNYPWSGAPIAAACEDQQGNLVVGTLGVGVFWYGPDGKHSWLSTNVGLSSDIVLSLCVDRAGDLWVGTDGYGLNRVKRRVFSAVSVFRSGTPSVIQSICEDNQGGLWIGSNGGGVSHWKDGAVDRFGPGQGLTNTSVWAVYVDRSQTVWAGTWGGGLFKMRDGQFQTVQGPEAIRRVVSAIYEDRGGKLWAGTHDGLAQWDGHDWRVFTAHEGLSAGEVRAIAEDQEGNMWVGTVGGGLNRLRDGRFTAFHKNDGLPSEDISSLYLDGDNVLWIGTFGGGLGRLHQGKFTPPYTVREGLASNSIGCLIEDGQGNLWITSNTGIMRVRKQDLNDVAREVARGAAAYVPCRAYGKADGLPTSECTLGSQPGACRTRDGKLWFPSSRGLVSMDPAQLSPNPHKPPVIIESVLIDGRPLNTNALRPDLPQPVVIPAGTESLEIQYTSLNLGAPDKGRFKYRLEDYETTWRTEAGNSGSARYSRLPPGRYRFRVQASNEDGLWNEVGQSVAFIVEPPLWRTWWFLGVTTTAILGAIVGGVHYLSTQRLQRQLELSRQAAALERERARIARDIHDQVGASLTQVSLLGELVESDKDCPAEVETHARQIKQTARETTRVLDEIVWAVNPSNDTLEGLMTYLCKYAQDYLSVAGLRCRLEVPAQLPSATMPPEVRHNVFLAFKEAVTNVVRHAAASAVWVRLHLEPAAFTLEIEDNGRGLGGLDEKAAQSRNGLRNMRQRMSSVDGEFSLAPAPEGGTVVRLKAPLLVRRV